MTPQDYCKQKTKESHSNFLFAFIFLNQKKRNALTALYAFCREVDDIVDESNEYKIGKNKLNWWRSEIDRLYRNSPQHPVTQALKPHINDFELDKAYFIEIIDGMEMDLNFNRYETFKHLQLYCYRVASTVGILSAQIFGYKDSKTLKYAHNLGIALQLTNIIRDIGEDARRGRIYIPLDDLKKFNITEKEILSYINEKKIRELVESQTKRAHDYYKLAINMLPVMDKRNQKPGLMMGNIYYELLSKIIKNNPENILNQKASLSSLKKLSIVLLTLLNYQWIK
ncbi:presqualene diphosphate synthase HpnD [Methylophilaceae bacterium]|jgi:15-cis-phytoene synthase|nr:presqualene diphosphate synthase HpnD [Methylophilaceae bacterium]|tara:strand:+ start:278 stop:1126 length:849 start_codon:yes stop_codon:yes gene_type:complete